MSEPAKLNVGASLVRIHRALTRGLSVSADRGALYAGGGFPDALTRNGFVAYVKSFVSVLRSHHQAEDELLFPSLRAIVPAAPYELLMANHESIELYLGQIETAIDQVAPETAPASALVPLNACLARILALWHPHIRKEERHFSAELLAALMEPEENARLDGQLAEHARTHAGPDYLVLPFILHNLSPDDRAYMAQTMPPIVSQQLVPVTWKEKWAPMLPFLLP